MYYKFLYSMRLIVASSNIHKVKEFAALFQDDLPFEVCSASICGGMPLVKEDGETFIDNAQKKALALRQVAPSDAWILSDDSGLLVDALDGAPGIYSARYAGDQASDEQNVDKLLEVLESVPVHQRTARFKCVLCLIDPDGCIMHFTGDCEGHIAKFAAAGTGFGYDPVFIPNGYAHSFAELGDAIKSELSHRALAVRSMCQELQAFDLPSA